MLQDFDAGNREREVSKAGKFVLCCVLWKADELWMNKIHTKWKAQVQLVLHKYRARCLTHDTQPSCVRQPVGSAVGSG